MIVMYCMIHKLHCNLNYTQPICQHKHAPAVIKRTEDNVCSPDSDFLQSACRHFRFFSYFTTVPSICLAWTLDGAVVLLYKVINDNKRKKNT